MKSKTSRPPKSTTNGQAQILSGILKPQKTRAVGKENAAQNIKPSTTKVNRPNSQQEKHQDTGPQKSVMIDWRSAQNVAQ
jgi:hypothetical protein